MIPPGETIGILGGGQLGRMLAKAAAQLGYRVHVYAPEADSVAAEVCARFTQAQWDDAEAMAAFAADCAVVTYEFENVPVGPLKVLGQVPLHPNARALEVAQDRLSEKEFVEQLGGRTAPYMAIDTREDLDAALARIGSPGILKPGAKAMTARASGGSIPITTLMALPLPGNRWSMRGWSASPPNSV